MKTYILFIMPLIFAGLHSTAQSPGGVNSNLKLWLKASLGITVGTGSNIIGWTDQTSTNTFTITGTPQLSSGYQNYNPKVVFDGSSRFTGNTSITNVTQVFVVGKISNPTPVNASGALIGSTSTSSFQYFFHTQGGTLYCGGNTTGVYTGYTSPNSIPYSVLSEDLGKTPAASDMVRLNGEDKTNTVNSDPAPFTGIPTIGSRGTENILNGSEIAEAVLYTSSLSAVNVNKVESYLAIKYGITLSNTGGGTAGDYTSSNGSLVWDASDGSGYHNNVIGIGRDDNSALTQMQSQQSDDSTRMYIGSYLGVYNWDNDGVFSTSNQFIMMGNNAARMYNNTGNAEFPPGLNITSRFDREWKITNTGFTGTFSIDIKPETGTYNATKILALIDDDGNFSNATVIYPTISYSGGVITISGISNNMVASNTTKYLTLATASAAPGGVSNESFWIKTDAGITQSAGAVSEWDDVSGNNIDLIQNSASLQPVLGTDTLNYYPVPAFDAVDDYLEDSTVAINALMNVSTGSNTNTTGSMFTVGRSKSSSTNSRIMYQWNRSPSVTNFYTESQVDATTGNLHIGSRSLNVGVIPVPNLNPFIGTVLETPGANNSTHYYNGGKEQKTTNATVNINTSTTNFLRVGPSMNGYVAEIVTYKTKVSDVQRRLVESYLAIKYSITLDTTTNGNGSTVYGDYIASDSTTYWDASVGNYVYHNNVIGIGRDDSTLLYQRQSHQLDDSTRIYISNLATTNAGNGGTFSSNKQFVMMGNNNLPLRHSYTNTEYPTGLGIYSRLDREWKITNTNFTGTFSLDIKPNASPITASDLRVLIDDDGNFTNATLYNPSISYSSGVISISGISNTLIPANSTKYLTVVSMNSTTPLPVGLINFTAKPVENKYVQLDWQTASEINSASFIIERSLDGMQWQELAKINGAGNSNQTLSYSYVDKSPVNGTSFYRLKQMDIDAHFSYSVIRSVDIDFISKTRISIYPNPAIDRVMVKGDEDLMPGISVYDAMGRDVSSNVKMNVVDKNHVMVSVASLPTGIYAIKTKNNSAIVLKK